jgi:nucleoside-diphosphate-sugar epimerase
MYRIFITGGAGYVGSRMVPYFLSKGYKITVYDTLFFTDEFLPKNDSNLKVIKGDIRDHEKIFESAKNHDFFINLACISNDTSFALDEKLSTSINLDSFEPMVLSAKKAGIKKFINASTSSVYGVSDQKDVKEDHPLVPLTLYNKYKGMTEPLLLKHLDDTFAGVIFRPATVCGYSPRQRLDLTVNILTNHAYHNKKIIVFGGDQLRPNLHIQDYIEVVELFINSPSERINKQIYNVGYQNLSVSEIAFKVKKVIEHRFNNNIEIEVTESDDNRSYHINSDKIFNQLGFRPKRTVDDAILELIDAFDKKLLINTFQNNIFYNVKRLKDISAK